VPGTRVDVVVDATRRAGDALANGEVDVAVMPWLGPDARLEARHVFDEEIVVAMRPDDALAARATVPIAALAERRVLTHEVPAGELAWIRATFGRSVVALRGVERLPLTEAIVALTRSGEGVSLLGAWTILEELRSGALVARPIRPALRRPFAVVTSRHRPSDPRAEVLATALRAWAGARRRALREIEEARPPRARPRRGELRARSRG
jgi:DNA-binding transcriptional LysR family regulator